MKPLRVGLIGARRARQGLGPFVARDLRAAGAEIACFLVTSEAARSEAAAQLARSAGVAPRGYLDFRAMLDAHPLDAVAICSPHASHGEWLDAALGAGLHALCEKPLVWGEPDLLAAARRRAAGFARRGLVLFENCQWPYALREIERVLPGCLDAPPRRFSMRMQPAGNGASLLADSLPHPLSLLQRLAPGAGASVTGVRFSATAPGAERVEIGFVYRAGGAAVEVEVELRPTQAHPREIRLAIDGREARRVVSNPGYRLALEGEGRRVEIEDPMRRLVADFAACAGQGADPDAEERGRAIVERAAVLGQLAAAWREAGGAP
jgi:predicted dehydrogenase